MFEALTNSNSDRLDSENIKEDNLPKEINEIISPLIIELKEENETLTLSEFTAASRHLYTMLDFNQKRILCDWYAALHKTKLCKNSESVNQWHQTFTVYNCK